MWPTKKDGTICRKLMKIYHGPEVGPERDGPFQPSCAKAQTNKNGAHLNTSEA